MLSRNEVKQALRQQRIETPSWAYGNTGTRFKVFKNPGAARTPHEKVDDAALVRRLTGVAPSIALHIPSVLAVAPGEAEMLSCEITAGPLRYTARVITPGQCDGAGGSSRTIRVDN